MYVLDRNDIEFYLEKLNNCSLLDAYKILNCKKKILSTQERAFLIPKDKLILFGKSDFYIQKISLPENLEKSDDKIYLIEDIIAKFCNSFSKISDSDWWLYAANYNSSSFRIVAGVGKGIILSRFLSSCAHMSIEISKTIVYLQRFGMGKNIKVFSPSKEIEIHPKINADVCCQKIITDECDEIAVDRLSGEIKPIITNRIHLKKILNDKILYAALPVMILVLAKTDQSIRDHEKIISALQKDIHITTKHIELQINSENFSEAKQFISMLKNLHDPLELFQKASKICRKYNLPVEQLLFENGSIVKIKTSLGMIALDQLKAEDNVEVEKDTSDEYEELGANKRLGAIVCVK
ncbi:MAG: hypothetical protein LBB25_01200 [Holosporaceae bacterium]|jgi:hypothetical protein|nr:hypothetical protein [Holosporaceae bacterium]